MTFQIPAHLIIAETAHWIVNHRIDTALPGYLMVGSRAETNDLSALPRDALTELGLLLSSAQKILTDVLRPEHLYIGRYGHMAGHAIHFHLIPIYSWIKPSFVADARYGVLKSFSTPGAVNSDFDGAELTLYIWREFCESKAPPPIQGPTVAEAICLLKQRWVPDKFPPTS